MLTPIVVIITVIVKSQVIHEIGKLALTLFGKVLAHQRIDSKLAVGYVTMLDRTSGYGLYRKAITSAKENFQRISELALMGTCIVHPFVNIVCTLQAKLLERCVASNQRF